MKSLLCVAGLAGLVVPAAHAASFDCAKATRPVEKLICRDKNLNALDERLGQVYRAGLQKLPTAGVGPLRADQVQWLAWVQEMCHAPEPDAPVTSAAAADVVACMLPLYEERTKLLRGVAIERDGVRFLVRTQYLAAPEDPDKGDFPGFGTLQVSWPLALVDSPEWKIWNQAAETAAYAVARDAQSNKDTSTTRQPQWTPELAKSADTEITLRVRKVEDRRVTSALSLESMKHGGPHPYELYSTETWLLDAKRPLRAVDVFQPGDAWKKAIAQACWVAIRAGDKSGYVSQDVTGPDSKNLERVIVDVGNWTLEHDGLHISYPEYAVSPRYARMDDTVIPWTALQPVLAKGFITP